MLLQTNSYIVPKDKRSEHARLLRRFRAALAKLGCDSFEVYEQVGSNWTTGEPTGRYVQIMRFRDRRHQQSVQQAERTDPVAQAIIAEFCQLINFPYQQQQGLFAVGFYNGVLPVAPTRPQAEDAAAAAAAVPQEQEAAAPELAPAEMTPAGEPFEAADAAVAEEVAHDSGTVFVGPGERADEAGAEAIDEQLESASPEAAAVDEALVTDETLDAADTSDASDMPAADVVAEEESGVEENGNPAPDTHDLGSLLDAHLDHLPDGNGHAAAHPLDHAPDSMNEGRALDLDLDDLDLRDEHAPDPQRSRNHVAP